jgi:hypothetical protein
VSAPPGFDWQAELTRQMDVELATFGQDVTYTPENGSPAFTLTGILDVGARREDSAPGTYALLFLKAAAEASGDGFKLHGGENCGISRKAEFRQIFVLQVQRDRLADIGRELIERRGFGDHGQIETLRDVLIVAAKGSHLNGSLHSESLASSF